MEGIRDGFRIGFDYKVRVRGSPANMASAIEHPEVVSDYLAGECSEGTVLGPLDPKDFPQVHTSRFRVIPKGPPEANKWRLIVDLSSPEGASINDGIGSHLTSLSYVGVKDAAEGIRMFGVGAQLAKVDIKRAYRNIPVHPEDRWMLGMRWEGGLFIDRVLPFGLRSAPKIFTAVSDAVEWVLRRQGVRFAIHYLDDFLVIGEPNSPECAQAVEKLLVLLEQLGFPVAIEKREGPVTTLEFLGLEVDSGAMEIRLPARKLEEIDSLLQQWRGRKVASRQELDSLVGKLAHASQVVQPGKTFLRRFF